MRATLPLALAAALLAAPASAERALTPEEFEALTAGRTMHFDREGAPFGAEQFFENGRVVWTFEGSDLCQRGIWFANRAGEICFVYGDSPEPQCWAFLERPDGRYAARMAGEDPEQDLVSRRIDDEPIECEDADIGI